MACSRTLLGYRGYDTQAPLGKQGESFFNGTAPRHPRPMAIGVTSPTDFSHAWCGCYLTLTSGSMSILLSSDCLVRGAGLSGVGCVVYFCRLLCWHVLSRINVFDARGRKNRWTHLLRFAGRRPA